jgi:pimeloyl-ACP methyl ester carboxylesterase
MFRQYASGIDWYCELRGNGPTIVLIPSGEGDCENFTAVAEALADEFTVLTFDMPGFSRTAAPPNFGKVTATMLSDQIADLLQTLGRVPATFYGCSSGGLAVLSLLAHHSDIARNGIVHEAALVNEFGLPDFAEAQFGLSSLDDHVIVGICQDLFRNKLNLNPGAWDDLGREYHSRLEKNYVTWVRHYGWRGIEDHDYTVEDLTNRPLAWSIGGFSEVWLGIANLRVAQRANINVEILPCRHFPQVEIPERLASHIRTHAWQCLGAHP